MRDNRGAPSPPPPEVLHRAGEIRILRTRILSSPDGAACSQGGMGGLRCTPASRPLAGQRTESLPRELGDDRLGDVLADLVHQCDVGRPVEAADGGAQPSQSQPWILTVDLGDLCSCVVTWAEFVASRPSESELLEEGCDGSPREARDGVPLTRHQAPHDGIARITAFVLDARRGIDGVRGG